MPRGRSRPEVGEWVQTLGEQIGARLGEIIAQSVQKRLERAIDVRELARRLGAGNGRGKGAPPARGTCTEEGCGNPVLAKGLCRSHYYRARYRAQKRSAIARGGARGRARRPQALAGEAGTP